MANAVESALRNGVDPYNLTLDPSRRRAVIDSKVSVLTQLVNDRDELPREMAVDVLRHLVDAIVTLDPEDRVSRSAT